MTDGETIRVEIAFGTPGKQVLRELRVRAGSCVGAVLEAGGLAAEFPPSLLENTQPGIWGRPVDPDHVVEEGDRVELYRPLEIDPREARRRLAVAGLTMADPGEG